MIEAGWGEVRRSLAAALTGDLPRTAMIQTPPPDGARVPAGDVLRLMALLRSLNVGSIQFEGAAPPLRSGAAVPERPSPGYEWSAADRARAAALRAAAPASAHLVLGLARDGRAALDVVPAGAVTQALVLSESVLPEGEGSQDLMAKARSLAAAHAALKDQRDVPWRLLVAAEAEVPWIALQRLAVAALGAGFRVRSLVFLDPDGDGAVEVALPGGPRPWAGEPSSRRRCRCLCASRTRPRSPPGASPACAWASRSAWTCPGGRSRRGGGTRPAAPE